MKKLLLAALLLMIVSLILISIWDSISIRSISGCVTDPRPRPAPPPPSVSKNAAKDSIPTESVLVSFYQARGAYQELEVVITFASARADDYIKVSELDAASPQNGYPQMKTHIGSHDQLRLKFEVSKKKIVVSEFPVGPEFPDWHKTGTVNPKSKLAIESFRASARSNQATDIHFDAFGVSTGFTLWRDGGLSPTPAWISGVPSDRIVYVKPAAGQSDPGEMYQPLEYYYSPNAAEPTVSRFVRWDFTIPDNKDPHEISINGAESKLAPGSATIFYKLDDSTNLLHVEVANNGAKVYSYDVPAVTDDSTVQTHSVWTAMDNGRSAATVRFSAFGSELLFKIKAKDLRSVPKWTRSH